MGLFCKKQFRVFPPANETRLHLFGGRTAGRAKTINVMTKMGAGSVSDLVRMALQAGILDR
jgi:hypothetical protein